MGFTDPRRIGFFPVNDFGIAEEEEQESTCLQNDRLQFALLKWRSDCLDLDFEHSFSLLWLKGVLKMFT